MQASIRGHAALNGAQRAMQYGRSVEDLLNYAAGLFGRLFLRNRPCQSTGTTQFESPVHRRRLPESGPCELRQRVINSRAAAVPAEFGWRAPS